MAVAFYPSLVLWSSQGLKDGPIVFFLSVSILATLKLGEKFSLKYLVVLICCLFSLLSLRFYVFYMISIAIGGAFMIGMQKLYGHNFYATICCPDHAWFGVNLSWHNSIRQHSVRTFWKS